ncbi:amino acid/amide ABC transporter ATP-binding protein 1 (HAAT family) [Anoxybacillus vitaminiphilus]|uniref:Amino acid/amide ABC transporter ATP-binding protein 1 (HAAT family) n=1 Tax=Paranoxybacillus vitaminiphilus TaxID=581036 RepID=A0A327Y2T8_9BACL|nr:ABC transporter ATP-binding protein [Anoxybacillus vitaminiphilus]RAK15064.1 amino acid/amide ABC transporter ATP-binding protein 1 (HAAT family) [Anoxybacillus vitaminiphilus]
MSLLKVENISKSFKTLQVLYNVSLEVKPGERHVIIGPNGAGKTTLFNCITNLLPIDSGSIYLDGKEISKLSPHHLVHLGMSRTFQKNNLFGDLTVEENLHLALVAKKSYRYNIFSPLASRSDIKKETNRILDQWEISSRRHIKVKNLSYGEQRLLEVLLAMASNPKILLLDEPTSGMSPAETAQTSEMIQKLPRSIALVVIEHDMEVVFAIADRITVLHHGEVILSGSPEEVRNNEMVKEIYFGGGAKQHA